MSTTRIADHTLATEEPRAEIIGESIGIFFDGDRVLVPFRLVERLRQRVNAAADDVERHRSKAGAAQGLRDLADFLERNPGIDVSWPAPLGIRLVDGQPVSTDDVVERAAALLGVNTVRQPIDPDRDDSTYWHGAQRRFGPLRIEAGRFVQPEGASA